MLEHALKEWAVICQALAEGKQSLLLRKGGIDEAGGAFKLAHTRFWLLPTWTHQQESGIVPEARPLLEAVEADRPPPGKLRLAHWAEVTGVYQIGALGSALLLGHLHLLSDETVRSRFAYRTPGLNLLTVRVYRAPSAQEIVDLPEYQGCHSWAELQTPLPTDGSVPVLAEVAHADLCQQLDMLLNPIAFA